MYGDENILFLFFNFSFIVVSMFRLADLGGPCWNLIPDSLDQVESQIDSNTIYYFEFQTWNLALQPA